MAELGIKIYLNSENLAYLRKMRDAVDFVEVLIRPEQDLTPLEKIQQSLSLPFTIHMAHGVFGTNPADPKLAGLNKKALECCKDAADRLSSDVIVVHPGLIANDRCTIESSISFLKENFDPRLHIENMPHIGCGFLLMGRDPDNIRKIMDETGMKFCFDVSHAFVHACATGQDPYHMIRDFIDLGPTYFHISDTTATSGVDDHLCLGMGDIDYGRLVGLLPKDGRYTFETQHIERPARKELLFLRRLLDKNNL